MSTQNRCKAKLNKLVGGQAAQKARHLLTELPHHCVRCDTHHAISTSCLKTHSFKEESGAVARVLAVYRHCASASSQASIGRGVMTKSSPSPDFWVQAGQATQPSLRSCCFKTAARARAQAAQGRSGRTICMTSATSRQLAAVRNDDLLGRAAAAAAI